MGAGQVEGPHSDLEALAFAAETIGERHFHFLQRQTGGVGGPDSKLAFLLPGHDPRPVVLDKERRYPIRPERGVEGGEHEVDLGDAGVGDKGLAAVQPVVVAVARGAGGEGGRIGAGAGLGEGERPQGDFSGLAEARQEGVFLLLRAGQHDRGGDEADAAQDGADAGAPPEDLLIHQQTGQQALDAAASVSLRDGVRSQTESVRLAQHGPRHFLGLVRRRCRWTDDVDGEAVRQVLQLTLLLAELEVDHPAFSARRSST